MAADVDCKCICGRVSGAVKHDHATAQQTVSDFMVHSRPDCTDAEREQEQCKER